MTTLKDNAVLGYTGFVGSNILRLVDCECDLYNSKNFEQLKNKSYDKIYCACLPGKKWLANKEPYQDFKTLTSIIEVLKTVKCNEFYLVSSQDCNSNQNSDEQFTSLPPTIYGVHRLYFEKFVEENFNAYIMRIGCLFGTGLKKNIIFDLLNDRVETIDNTTYQLYFIDNIIKDFNYMYNNNIHVMNNFSEPVYVDEIARCLNKHVNVVNTKMTYNNKGLHILDKNSQLKYLKDFGIAWNKLMVVKK